MNKVVLTKTMKIKFTGLLNILIFSRPGILCGIYESDPLSP